MRDLLAWMEGPLPFDEVGREPRIEDNSRGLLDMICDAANVYLFSIEGVPEQESVGEGEDACM